MTAQGSHSGEGALSPALQARLIEEICDRFEVAWKGGRRPRIEEFLNPALRSVHGALLPELLAVELAYRRRGGERPSAAEYRQRFPSHGKVIRAVWQNLAEPGETTAPVTVAGGRVKTMTAKPSPTMHTPGDADLESPAIGAEEAGPADGVEAEIPVAASAWPEIPGYEILGKLGEGGMGVVYKARQVELNRLVALKMILPARAGEQGVARFRVEAEAVAQMQHPNIVQIFEIGEHEGQPFFSLEYVEGGSLADRLDGTPWPGAPAAALVETLARAMEAAHRRQIIHRDLKPANVLLAADGTPKITDFGLAKRLDGGSGHTQIGVIMGTPSYMALEQAQGRNDEVGPAADVYALGAILYELLTGRPPFQAATPLDTVLQVINEEPVPLRKLQPKIPRDLETICLTCLEKSPSRRYASAGVLAKDLWLFREGRPIEMRPVGLMEKMWRWGRRNPVVSGLLAAVVFAVFGGLVFSMSFAFDAAEKAEQARRNEEEANKKKAEAEAAKSKLETAIQESLRYQNELERASARSTLRPMGLQPGGLTDPEIEALWQLAENRGKNIWSFFVAEAIRGPVTTRQLFLRAEYGLHAAVGLDLDKRQRVEQLLVAKLQEPNLAEAQRFHLALLAASLGGLSAKASDVVARVMEPALLTKADNIQVTRERLTVGLAVAAHLRPKDAARVLSAHTQALINSLMTQRRSITQHGIEYSLRFPFTEYLAAVGDRLRPADAAALADTLTRAMSRMTTSAAAAPLTEELAAVAICLEPADAVRVLTQAAIQTRNSVAWTDLVHALAIIAERLGPADAARLADSFPEILTRAITVPDASAPRALTRVVASVAGRLEPGDVARLTDTLAQVVARAQGDPLTRELVAAVAARLKPGDVARLADTLTEVIAKAKLNNRSARELMAPVAARLEPAYIARLAEVFTHADPGTMTSLARRLAAVSDRLGPADAARLADTLTRTVIKPFVSATTNSIGSSLRDSRLLSPCLAAAAVRLEPADAARLADTLAETVITMIETDTRAGTGHLVDVQPMTQCLAAAATRLESARAARLADTLTRVMTQSLRARAATKSGNPVRTQPFFNKALTDVDRLRHMRPLAECLVATATRLEPTEAARRLTQAVIDARDSNALVPLARGLALVANHLKPAEAARLTNSLTETVSGVVSGRQSFSNLEWVRSLAVVAARLNPSDAARLADMLTQIMAKEDRPFLIFEPWAEYLAAVAARLEPADAVRLADTIVQARFQSATRQFGYDLKPLAAATAHLKPREAGRLVEALIRAMTKETNKPAEFWLLAQLAAYPDIAVRSYVGARLHELGKGTNSTDWDRSVRGLVVLLIRADSAQLSHRSAAFSAVSGHLGGGGHLAGVIPYLRALAEPVPCRFTTQEMVEFLKQPTCVGSARRAILDQLGNQFGRTFADQWQFVNFAREQGLALDFTSPPVRLNVDGGTKPQRLKALTPNNEKRGNSGRPNGVAQESGKAMPPPKLGLYKREFEAKSLKIAARSHCKLSTQPMDPWGKQRWSRGKQLFCWCEQGGWLEFDIPVEKDGSYQVDLKATRAPDYGRLQVTFNGKTLDQVIDAYGSRVEPMDPVRLGTFPLKAGSCKLRLTVVGKNPAAKGYFFGIDTISLTRVP